MTKRIVIADVSELKSRISNGCWTCLAMLAGMGLVLLGAWILQFPRLLFFALLVTLTTLICSPLVSTWKCLMEYRSIIESEGKNNKGKRVHK